MKTARRAISITTPPPACSVCTTPRRCGTPALRERKGPHCAGRANGPDTCDCLNSCGDDPWLPDGRAVACDDYAAKEQHAAAAALWDALTGWRQARAGWARVWDGRIGAGQAQRGNALPQLLLGIAGAGVIALTLGVFGPSLDDVPDMTPAELLEQDSQAMAARWEAEARRRCALIGGDNTGYIPVAGGGIVCTDKRGRKLPTPKGMP
jgi:hypothetical protein